MAETVAVRKGEKWGRRMELAAYGLLFLGLCLFHFTTEESGDTVIFRQYVSQWGLMEFLSERLHSISGRVLLEALLYLVLKAPSWVFSWLNTAIVLSGVALCKYLMDWDSWETGIFAVLLLVFPVNGLVEVGLQPGFINYVWALVFSLAALVPLRMVEKKMPFFWYHGFLFGAAALAGCNMEQTAAVVTGFYLVFIVYFGRKKKLHPILFFQLFLSAGSLLFLRMCEGNIIRMQIETSLRWPGFARLTMAEKLWNGWITTVNHLYSVPNEPVLIFSCTLCLWLIFKKKSMKKKIDVFSLLAVLSVAWAGIVCGVKILDLLSHGGILEKLNGIRVFWDGQGRMTASPIPVYPQIFLYSLLAVGIIAAVAGSFLCWDEAGFYFLLFGAGFASRMVMSFSPTLIASNTRTFLFFHFSLYLGAMHYIHQLRKQLYKRA